MSTEDKRTWAFRDVQMPHAAFSKLAASVSSALGGPVNKLKTDQYLPMLLDENYIRPIAGGYEATPKGVEFWRHAFLVAVLALACVGLLLPTTPTPIDDSLPSSGLHDAGRATNPAPVMDGWRGFLWTT